MLLSPAELKSLIDGTESCPHRLLGHHSVGGGGTVVRGYFPGAIQCEILKKQSKRGLKMTLLHELGLFERTFKEKELFRYQFKVTYSDGTVTQVEDPYRFLPTISEYDLFLFGKGDDHQIYQKLGSHLRTMDGVKGVSFAVWAPSARRVSVVGDHNFWNGRAHPMRSLGASGVWELFIPHLQAGARYKFEIVGPHESTPFLKTDPFGLQFEPSPNHAAIVCDLSGFIWHDEDWMESRRRTNSRLQPVSIYEVHLASWRRVPEEGNRLLSYQELGEQLAEYCQRLGFSHVELMPPAEHPFDGSWGYQVTGFYAPTHRFGSPWDFMTLVDTLHRAGIGVIIDWVPAHFPKDAFALAQFDGTHLYEHADSRLGEHQDWGTLIFNYGRHEVRGFLVGSALSWLERFHIDGLRVDAVASMLYLDYSRKDGEWIPNRYGGRENLDAIEFLRQMNALVHVYHAGAITIAEESTSYPGVTKPINEGGLGFDYKWNMGWMHDTLGYFKENPLFRKYHHHQLTFGMLYQWSEAFVQSFSHDEVVHGKGSLMNKMAGDGFSEKAANLRCLLALQWAWPGKKSLFMGCEFGQFAEWNFAQSLDWHLLQYPIHSGLQKLVTDLNALLRRDPTIAERDYDSGGFTWIHADDASQSVLTFARHGYSCSWVVAGNFTPVERTYRIGVPTGGFWEEALNTNASAYAGSGLGNLGGVQSQPISAHGFSQSIEVCLPGLSLLIFRKTTV
ncbi:1,4-alpha-glucan branching protein GlgB [bacterium]|nr:1,4-alpha-glucan branching protein GlgB [bacterium]